MKKRLVVLASGQGSNLAAILHATANGQLDAEVVAVISHKADARALQRARDRQIPALFVALPPKGSDRTAWDAALASTVAEYQPDLVVLAGWMRILSPSFLNRFPGQVINLHPALPGELPGMDAIARAWKEAQEGQRQRTGVMVHRVVPEVDAGPVLAMEEVRISEGESQESLEERIHAVEHRLMVLGIRRALAPQRALLSVHDKTGLLAFAGALTKAGWELVASGGTARALIAAGFSVIPVENLTGYPELLGGRVKTLHPAIHAGILSRRTAADEGDLATHGLAHLDLVAVSLYPFEETVLKKASEEAIIEEIDIGGVTLLRAAAKNHAHVWVVPGPDCYAQVLQKMEEAERDPRQLPLLRRQMALLAFARTAAYDTQIARWMGADLHIPGMEPAQPLRYGENPHQSAAFHTPSGRLPYQQHSGKELSYNNLLDLEAAWTAVMQLQHPGAVLVKHGSPCGIAVAGELVTAYRAALASDPVSAFGGVLALNRTVDEALVEALGDLFLEVIAAPGVTEGAAKRLAEKKKNCRVLQMDSYTAPPMLMRSVLNGILLQAPDGGRPAMEDWKTVTTRVPDAAQNELLSFAFWAVKHVKSNAIVLAIAEDGGFATVGIGGGQTNRVDAVRQAIARAKERSVGAVLASDAFFPFADSIAEATSAGISAIIQPGGALRDREVIGAAEAAGITMVLTGRRHFKH